MKKFTSLSAILLCTVCMAYGQWTYTNLSEAKAYMGATVLGSKAYFAGGFNNSTMLSTVEIYDFTTGEWDITNNLSVARELPFAVACGSKVLFAGGADFYGSGAVYATVDIYDTVDQSWALEQLSVARLQAAVVSHGNKVLFAGGANLQQGIVYDIVDIFDVETGVWTTASLSEPRVVWWATIGDLAIFAGGYDLQTVSKRVDIYNFTTDTWSIDSLSVGRAFCTLTTIGSKVMIAGGMTAANVRSNVVDIYDAATGTWDTAYLSFPRAFCDNQNAVTLCGKAFFVGGGNINLNGAYWTDSYNVIDIYDEATDTWSVDYLSNSPIHHAVVAYEDQFVVAGGIISTGYQSTVEIYRDPTLINVPDDYSTIQEGINAASDGDTIIVTEGTYYENINYWGKAIILASEFILDGDTNHISNTIIDGSQPVDPDYGSVVIFGSGEDTTSVLCGFTITGGIGTLVSAAGDARFGGGVLIASSGGKLLNNYIEYNIISNENWASGGGVFAAGPVTTVPWVVLRSNRINYNKAESLNDEGDGGGVDIWCNLIMIDNQVSYNEANGATRGDCGGVRIRGDHGDVQLNIRNNVITHNKAMSVSDITELVLGGGLNIFYDCFGVVSNNVISFNEIEVAENKWGYGAGVLIELQNFPDPDFVFKNNFITDNDFTGGYCAGGGVCIYNSGGKFQNNVIQNNKGTHGGGIALEYNSINNQAMFINNTVTGNEGTYGGGLYTISANAVVINTIIWGNTAPEGASVYEQGGCILEIRYSDVQSDVVWPGEGNINEEPLFQSDSYHLEYESPVVNPVVNAGILSVSINGIVYDCPPYDIDGDLRPYLNTHPEIGVDEVPVLETGVSISSLGLSVNLYPNPSKDKITISSPSITENTQLSIFNVSGEKVLERQLTNNETQIDISALPRGVYFVKVQDENMVEVGKMVKD